MRKCVDAEYWKGSQAEICNMPMNLVCSLLMSYRTQKQQIVHFMPICASFWTREMLFGINRVVIGVFYPRMKYKVDILKVYVM
jgi:hypothetical protein